MSKILELTEKGWKTEIQTSDLPERTKNLITEAIKAKTSKKHHYPKVSDNEFNNIVDNQVFFIRLGNKALILDKKGKGNRLLFLQEEKDE